MAFFLIDPNEKLDFSLDLGTWLDTGVAITGTPVWTISPSGPTISDESLTGNIATAFISGCTRGQIYILECQGLTDNAVAQTVVRSLTIRCDDR